MWLLFVIVFFVDLNIVCNADRGSSYNETYGFRQSPIAINICEAALVELPPLYFALYNETLETPLRLHNNGKFIELKVPETASGLRPYIKGSILNDKYVVDSVHFHWGSMQQKGSEHEVNGFRYDLEMHIVHKNVKFISKREASNHRDGLAVLGVLFQVVEPANVYYPGLNEIFKALDHVVKYNTTTSTDGLITLDSLLGSINTDEFFVYEGSLTTSPYNESVTWHVFPNAIPISPTELAKFWNIQNSTGQPLLNNFRPIQDKTGRHIYYRIPYEESKTGCPNT